MRGYGDESRIIRFLYGTVPGRMILKPLVSSGASRLAGWFLSSSFSKRMIPGFISKHNIDMTGMVVPCGGYSSFNDFFTRRRLRKQDRPLQGQMICPCDGLLSAVHIEDNTELTIKGSSYRTRQLLEDELLAEAFRGGVALIFRLTPQHYHRYCYCVDGEVLLEKRIDGELHCVRPIALETVPVFIRNSREYQVIRTESGHTLVQMEVGALLVGKISNHHVQAGEKVQAGQEKGFFEFGGSTIILLLTKGSAGSRYDRLIDRTEERPVRMGERITHETAAQAVL